MPERSRRPRGGDGYPASWRTIALRPPEPSQEMLEDAEAFLNHTIGYFVYNHRFWLRERGDKVLPAEMGGLVQKILAKSLDIAVHNSWVKPVTMRELARRAIPEKIVDNGARGILRTLPFCFGARQVEMETDAGVRIMADQLVVVGEALDNHIRRQQGACGVLAVSVADPEDTPSTIYVRPSPKSPESLACIQVTDLAQGSIELLAMLRGKGLPVQMVSDPRISELFER